MTSEPLQGKYKTSRTNKTGLRWLIILVASAVHWTVGNSQPGFNSTFDMGGSLRFISIENDEDVLYVIGFLNTEDTFQTGIVTALDTFGKLKWWSEITDDSSSITVVRESNFSINGDRIAVPFGYFHRNSFGVAIFDRMGNIVHKNEYPQDMSIISIPTDIIATNSGYLISGVIQMEDFNANGFVFKVDTIGQQMWMFKYGHPVYWENVRSITVRNENELILSGTRYQWDQEPIFYHGWAVAIDSLGNKKWEWEASEAEVPHRGIMSMQYDSLNDEWVYVSFIEKPVFVEDLGRDVGLYAPVLVRRDSAMQLLSYDKYGPYSYKGYMGSLVKSRSGGWIAAGNTTCLTEDSPYNNCNIESGRVIKLSPEGELEWSVIDTAFYNTELGSRSYLSGVTESPTGSVYAVGWANNYDSAGVYRSYGWLLKITADGCVDTLCTTTSLMEQIRDLGQKVKVYPNPVTDYIVFEIADSADNLRAVVCDMQGRELSTTTCGPGANVMMLNQNFSPGLYLWRVLNGRGEITGSGKFMVVQK